MQKYNDIRIPQGTRVNIFRYRDDHGLLVHFTKLVFPNGQTYMLAAGAESQLWNLVGESIRTLRSAPIDVRNQRAQSMLWERLGDEQKQPLYLRYHNTTHKVEGVVSGLYAEILHEQVFDVLETVLSNRGHEWVVKQKCETPQKAYRRYLLPNITFGEGMEKHTVGLHVANSEVGRGSVRIYLYLERMVCTNGLMAYEGVYQAGIRHIGDKQAIHAKLGEMVDITLATADAMGEHIGITSKQPLVVDELHRWLYKRRGYPLHLVADIATNLRKHPKPTVYNAIVELSAQSVHGGDRVANSYIHRLQQDAYRLLTLGNEAIDLAESTEAATA